MIIEIIILVAQVAKGNYIFNKDVFITRTEPNQPVQNCSQLTFVNSTDDNSTYSISPQNKGIQPNERNEVFISVCIQNTSILTRENYTTIIEFYPNDETYYTIFLLYVPNLNMANNNTLILKNANKGTANFSDMLTNKVQVTVNCTSDQDIVINNSNIYSNMYLLFLTKDIDIILTNRSAISTLKLGFLSKQLLVNESLIEARISVCKSYCTCQNYQTCDLSNLKNQENEDFPSLQQFFSDNFKKPVNPDGQYDLDRINTTLFLKSILEVNFTLAILTSNLTLNRKSAIQGAFMGIYISQNVQMNSSSITTDGRGCKAAEGLGCGYLDWIIGLRLQCGGTGASHGGIGGFSSSQKSSYISKCLQMRSRQIYGNPFHPIFEGSGGGAQPNQKDELYKANGNGGGVLFLEALNLTLNNSNITCNGEGYAVNPNYGSGSGGAMQIRTYFIQGYEMSSVQANGGGGISNWYGNSYGGVGAGGRILFLLQANDYLFPNPKSDNYSNTANNASLVNVTFDSSYGFPPVNLLLLGNQKGYNWTLSNGTIIPLPCQQGFNHSQSNFICQPCSPGYYKPIAGYGHCSKCINYQSTAIYDSNNTLPLCPVIRCEENQDAKKERNNQSYQCVTQMENFVDSMGGSNGLFAVFYAVFLLLINIIIIWCKRQKSIYRESKLPSQSSLYIPEEQILQKKEQSSAIKQFITQDLAYHIKRIYVSGTNVYNNPWAIYKDSSREFSSLTSDRVYELFSEFNKAAEYSIFQKSVLIFLRYYYYPIYLLVLKYYQREKYFELSELLMAKKADALDTNNNGQFFKFTVSSDFTLCFIDILDYNRSPLDWDTMTQFPVCLVLTGLGTFMFPLQINLKDPIIKHLWDLFAKQNEYYEEQREFNCLEDFVFKFNYFAKLIDFRQSNNSFIKHYLALVKFTDHYNKNIFNTQNKLQIQVDLCVHIISKVDNQVSRLIMLSLSNHKDLERCLSEIHNLNNFSDRYQISFSINFDRIRENVSEIFDEQIVIETKNNLNRQLDDYRQYEDEKELLKNLKQKFMKRLEAGQEYEGELQKKGKYAFSYKQFDNYSVIKDQSKKENRSIAQSSKSWYFNFKRGFSWFSSQITRYRSTKKETKVLQGSLILLLLLNWILAIIYPFLLKMQNSTSNMSDSQQQQFLTTELIVQFIIFPFSELISPILLTIWLMNQSRSIGKFFLMFNLCAATSCLIEFFISIIETFIQLGQQESSDASYIWTIPLIKIFQIFIMLLTSHLMCMQMNNIELEYVK